MIKAFPRVIPLGLVGFTLFGCGQAAPVSQKGNEPDPSKPEVAKPAEPKQGDTGTSVVTAPNPGNSANPTASLTPTSSGTGATFDSQSFPEAAFLPDDVAGVAVIHPKRLLNWPLVKMLRASEIGGEMTESFSGAPVDPEIVERLTIVLDPASLNKFAKEAGLEVEVPEDAPAETTSPRQLMRKLKDIGLAFHNYESSYVIFPRHNGDGEGKQTGLSWRVHLLPYLDQGELYREFHMDEPWDSDHNKTLIEKMPEVFVSPGVTDAGKTSVHVFAGEGTPFHGQKGPTLRDFTDGTSNSILAVLAGADTADIWTKPGGLPLNEQSPKKALGKLEKDELFTLFADGSVRLMSADLENKLLIQLIQHNDGSVIDNLPQFENVSDPPGLVVPSIIRLANPVNQEQVGKAILGDIEEQSFEGKTLLVNEPAAVCFVEETLIVMGPSKMVQAMLSRSKTGAGAIPASVAQIQPGSDLSFAGDLESQSKLLAQVVQINPMLGLAMQIKSLGLNLNVTTKPGGRIVDLAIVAANEQAAATLAQLAQVGLAQGKTAIPTIPQMGAAATDQVAQVLIQNIIKSAEVKQAEDRVTFSITAPDNYDKLPELLKPAVEKAAVAAAATRRRNDFKQIGLAFHNYHDAYTRFPGAGRMGSDRDPANDKVGLSWRVHLLPYLDQAPLYQQFNLDEPWDSEHNKKLINQMPKIYRSEGVNDPGKTTIHVFTGPGAPFADDAAPGLIDITDGTSNTILLVEAGPETAEIWTKPGGLDFDPQNPIKSLGTLARDTFRILMCDGSVREARKAISPETLRNLIQSRDGNPIPPNDF